MLGRWQVVAQTADKADLHPNEVKDADKNRSAVVAEVRVLMRGGPKDGDRKPATVEVAGWR